MVEDHIHEEHHAHHEREGNNSTLMVGLILVAVVIVFLLFFFSGFTFPGFGGNANPAPSANIDVPDQVDVNVNRQ